ncbi:TrkH family potassium uptake protein [Lacticaseibacillus mingshuiensis]|uniref:TrkH family potassium uptake protein n=1 Tax=Lacticaseibacillus mingshuiensis TaxID=2799574 RepID=A0ABW4CI68_9LACO|nr:potassium transporter TrkG [Lacticaseibacillus mingshuiensis]
MSRSQRFHLSAAQAILLSFALMILVGALLLTLPMASQNGRSIGFLDALFTAVSAGCVTGLVVVNTMQHWTLFGQLVILLLIQFGGIGFITVVTGAVTLFRRRIGLRQRLVVQAMFAQNDLAGMGKLTLSVMKYTAAIEGVGALFMTAGFLQADRGYDVGEALWYGIFHAVSAFCNAGFDIVGLNSLEVFRTDPLLNWTIMCLIVLGGLGFTVLHELSHFLTTRKPRKRALRRLSLQAKLVLLSSGLLLIGGAVLFAALEWNRPSLAGLSAPQKWLASAFESVTLRTAGFATTAQDQLGDLSKLAASAFMFIGGSPAGTAGGIKTISVALLVGSAWAAMRGQNGLVLFGRRIPQAALNKALAITCTMMAIVVCATLALHFTEVGNAFHPKALDLLFETTSAAGTVGLTTGMTPYLSAAGKGIIALCMFIGRLSPLTLAVALATRQTSPSAQLDYPEEDLILG